MKTAVVYEYFRIYKKYTHVVFPSYYNDNESAHFRRLPEAANR